MNNHNKIPLLTLLLALALPAAAQKFDAERFEAERAHYMVTETQLSEQDSATFFALYNELQQRKRKYHDMMKALPKELPPTEDSCRAVISQRDMLEVQMKAEEGKCHAAMMRALPGTLVFRLLKAESAFYRKFFHRASNKQKKK